MINPIRPWLVRRRPATKAFIGIASRFREDPDPAMAELLVQLTPCPCCSSLTASDCCGTRGCWDSGWLLQGDDGHRQPRFHASRVKLAQQHLGATPLRRADAPPDVSRREP